MRLTCGGRATMSKLPRSRPGRRQVQPPVSPSHNVPDVNGRSLEGGLARSATRLCSTSMKDRSCLQDDELLEADGSVNVATLKPVLEPK